MERVDNFNLSQKHLTMSDALFFVSQSRPTPIIDWGEGGDGDGVDIRYDGG